MTPPVISDDPSEIYLRVRAGDRMSAELAGDPKWMKTIFVGGLKTLPIRYEMMAA